MDNKKYLCFDMDGTIADFYGVENWLEKIRNYDPAPYQEARPFYDTFILNTLLQKLKEFGWTIAVISWLSKDSTKEYNKEVRKAKREWLEKYEFPADEIHLVKYGTYKKGCIREKAQEKILIDDNATVRKEWGEYATIDASKNIIPMLCKMIALEEWERSVKE
jgi:hypothetical protein